MSTSPTSDPSTAPQLARRMGLFSLVVYGVGDMVGSGIYGTVGKAADVLGNAVWLGFGVSMVAALLTGLSYACLSSRYPRAAGAAYVTQRAYRLSFLSYLIGMLVTASGLTSMATSSNVVTNTLASMTGLPAEGPAWIALLVGFLVFMTAVNFWGIRQSMWTNLVCTTIEVSGLLFLIVMGLRFWGSVDYFQTPAAVVDAQGVVADHGLGLSMVLAGSVLTFFSFIGFEDMLNVAEEVKEPERTMPWGIVLALAIVAVLYMTFAITAVSVVDFGELAQVAAPLALISARVAPWLPPRTYEVITLFAVANTMLINFIMSSRMLYGMARHRLLPAVLGQIHATRRTPHVAIFTLVVLVFLLAVSAGEDAVRQLADATSLLLLFSFMTVNSALVVLKLRPSEPPGKFEVPIAVPLLGIAVNGLLIGARLTDPAAGMRAPVVAGVIVVVATGLYFVTRPRNVEEVFKSLDA